MNTISNGELSDPLCDSVNRGLTFSQIVRSPKAEILLRGVIQRSVVYKHAEDYVMAMGTFYVELFNNV